MLLCGFDNKDPGPVLQEKPPAESRRHFTRSRSRAKEPEPEPEPELEPKADTDPEPDPETAIESIAGSNPERKTVRMSSKLRGVGYATDNEGWEWELAAHGIALPPQSASSSSKSKSGQAKARVSKEAARKKTLDLAKEEEAQMEVRHEVAIQLLVDLMPQRHTNEEYTPLTDFDDTPPEELLHLIRLSSVLDIMAQALRHDSLDYCLQHSGLHTAVLSCVERWSDHPSTQCLVTQDRLAKDETLYDLTIGSRNPSLSSMENDSASSLSKSMYNLVASSETVLTAAEALPSAYSRSKRLMDLCKRIRDISGKIKTISVPLGPDTDRSKLWSTFCEENRVGYVEDEEILSGHNYEKEAKAMKSAGSARFKRLVEDLSILKTSLPEGIFVKLANSRPDVMKFLIVGPPESPYAGGLFEFDMICPADYPKKPPQVFFGVAPKTGIRLNPNLHTYGMVCLSLLGTWSGTAAEAWQPGRSTLLQLLVSMQSMIFCSNPFYNEPGYGHIESKVSDERYSAGCQALTVRIGMLYWLQNDTWKNGLWKDVFKTYMSLKSVDMLETARRWAKDNKQIQAYSGFCEPMDLIHEHKYLNKLSPEQAESKKNIRTDDLLEELETAVAAFEGS